MSDLTAEKIEQREFTYCTANYLVPDPDPRWVRGLAPVSHHFVVGSPYKAEALERARTFATVRWGPPESIYLYPRTYVRDARELFARGMHD